MDSKMLSIRSFEKNQTLLTLINKIIISTKLESLGAKDTENENAIGDAKAKVIQFLETILNLVGSDFQGTKVLTRMDARDRAFVRNFIDAKRRPQKYRSILFKGSPGKVIDLLKSNNSTDRSDLIEALTELRDLIEEHLSLDVKGLVGDF